MNDPDVDLKALMRVERNSLFARLRQPREARDDWLMKALAATLAAAPGAATLLASRWYPDEDAGGQVAVRTQRSSHDRGRVDLELVFGPPSRPTLRLWIASDSGVRPEQALIERYTEALPDRHARCRQHVCWLLPVDEKVAGRPAEQGLVFRWDDLAAVLDDWQFALPPGEREGYAAGLVREFLLYLEEEGLAATSPIEAKDVDVLWLGPTLLRYPVAVARFRELIRRTSAQIEKERGVGERSDFPRESKIDFWEALPAPAPWSQAKFEWRIRPEEPQTRFRGRWRVIGAGVSWQRGHEPEGKVLDTLRDRFAPDGFELGTGADATYLCRYRTFTDLIGKGGLRDQAGALASWVLDAWRTLEDGGVAGVAPPPRDV